MSSKPGLVRLSYLFYGVLVVAVLVLARSLEFAGPWNLLTVTLLVAYLFAPQLIWKLCVTTHEVVDDEHSEIVSPSPSHPRGTTHE